MKKQFHIIPKYSKYSKKIVSCCTIPLVSSSRNLYSISKDYSLTGAIINSQGCEDLLFVTFNLNINYTCEF